VYSGSWVTDAKKYFSKNGCAAYQIANKYLTGAANRQDYLETAISWEAESGSDEAIELYMANRQHDSNALLLWNNFRSVITWVDGTFTKYRPPMKGVDWGALYKKYGGTVFDTGNIEAETARLMLDDDVTKKSGIYPFILTREQSYLAIRAFTPAQKNAAYEKQKGVCPLCGKQFPLEEMEGDHIRPWAEGGKTGADNLQMLCKDCNRRKGKK
jgi:hypothetical protein